jgi:hypothetical protein
MVLNATFNNISVLLVEETEVLGENHRPVSRPNNTSSNYNYSTEAPTSRFVECIISLYFFFVKYTSTGVI